MKESDWQKLWDMWGLERISKEYTPKLYPIGNVYGDNKPILYYVTETKHGDIHWN